MLLNEYESARAEIYVKAQRTTNDERSFLLTLIFDLLSELQKEFFKAGKFKPLKKFQIFRVFRIAFVAYRLVKRVIDRFKKRKQEVRRI